MKIPNLSKIMLGGAAVGLFLLNPCSAAVIIENFTGIPDGTALTSVTNWSQQSGSTNTATVQDTAGYAGPGGRIPNAALYQYSIPTDYRATVGSEINGYSVKLQLTPINNYQIVQILFGKSGGVNGMAVEFNGGTSDITSDNYIRISTGGTGWGSNTYATVASSAWTPDHWYQVDFTNIALVSSGFGPAVTGNVTITNLTTSTVFVNNHAITGFGNSGVFNTIDTLLIGNKGTARVINFDDIAAIPEPSTVALLVGALAAILLIRRKRSSPPAKGGAMVVACLLAGSLSLHAAFEENFSAPEEGSLLSEAEGWRLHYGDDETAVITLSAGASGQGVRIERNEQYRRAIPHDQAHRIEEGNPGVFRAKVRIAPVNDGYTLAQVLVGAEDGIHGLAVRFNGGDRDGLADNFVQVSRGGENWGSIAFADFKEAAWQKDTWYDLLISDIVPEPGSHVVRGKLTLREADDASAVLLDGVPIQSTGSTGSFLWVDTVVVGNCGTARTFDIDDIVLKSGTAD